MGNMKELKQLHLSKISHEQICEISQGNRKSHKFLYVSDNQLTHIPDTIGKEAGSALFIHEFLIVIAASVYSQICGYLTSH
jgi:uncharacterized protein YcgL (UPF0745 family)